MNAWSWSLTTPPKDLLYYSFTYRATPTNTIPTISPKIPEFPHIMNSHDQIAMLPSCCSAYDATELAQS